MREPRREIAIIADLPGDLRAALRANFLIAEEIIEGAGATAIEAVSTRYRAIATRAVLGVPAALLARLDQLELVLSDGAGLDHIDTAALAARGIELVHTPDQFTEDVADFALGLIYAAQRRIVAADRFVRRGAWIGGRFGKSRRVTVRRVGILGLGRVGRRLAEKCSALGMPVSYHARTRHRDVPYGYRDKVLSLARDCDILVLACALTGETRRAVNANVLTALGPEGILINVARGPVVDEEALIAALERGSIGGAALDVYDSEPDFDPRLLAFDNVILTPHSAGFTVEARQDVIDHLIGGANGFFARRPVPTR